MLHGRGYYWSSSAIDESNTYYVFFCSSSDYHDDAVYRSNGYSVRLTTEVK